MATEADFRKQMVIVELSSIFAGNLKRALVDAGIEGDGSAFSPAVFLAVTKQTMAMNAEAASAYAAMLDEQGEADLAQTCRNMEASFLDQSAAIDPDDPDPLVGTQDLINGIFSSLDAQAEHVAFGATAGKVIGGVSSAIDHYEVFEALVIDQDYSALLRVITGMVITSMMSAVLVAGAVAVGILSWPVIIGIAAVTAVVSVVTSDGLESFVEDVLGWDREPEDELRDAREMITQMVASTGTAHLPTLGSYIAFGSAGHDVLIANEEHDSFLIGGSGNDVLYGGVKNDRLSGGAGNDVLHGGAGNDKLAAGGDDDTLEGGAGDDQLEGGTGFDVYKFTSADLISGDYTDTIVDADGLGRILFNNIEITGTGIGFDNIKHASLGAWETADGKFRIALVGSGDEQSLLIMHNDSKSHILVKGWSNGDLGIVLPGIDPPPNTAAGELTHSDDLFGQLGTNGGNDVVKGIGGNDGIEGGAGNDELDGGIGEDLIFGGSGNDKILGGTGNDYIFDGSELIDMRPWSEAERNSAEYDLQHYLGDGVLKARGASWYIVEGGLLNGVHVTHADNLDPNLFPSGNDVIDAGDGSDVVYAGEGDDIVAGGEGNDTLYGGYDDDTISGGAGNDLIAGDHGNMTSTSFLTLNVSDNAEANGQDIIDAGAGDDYVLGAGGNDVINGGEDNDTLYGRGLGNTLIDAGDADQDHINGGAGNDFIFGDDGDDVLEGGTGNDQIRGDNDEANVRMGNDTIDAGTGDDLVWGDGGNDIIDGGEGIDILRGDGNDVSADKHGIDWIKGGLGADQISGDGGADILEGGDGNDTIYGDLGAGLALDAQYQGNDYISGGAGDDFLVGDGGNDTLDGGADGDSLQGGDGTDLLIGGAGNDILHGQADNDILRGDEGDDQLNGGDGDDSLSGGGGNDIIAGGVGVDAIDGGEGGDNIDGGADNDTIHGGNGHDVMDGDAGDDVLHGEGEADSLYGGTGNDRLYGGAANDVLRGEEGNDVLDGGTGNDTLYGEAGNDALSAGDGDDMLLGGTGDDTLEGGAGLNHYYFDRGFGNDVVHLGDGVDQIVFQGGITTQELAYTRSGNDLLINLVGQADQLRIVDYFTAGPQVTIFTADGAAYTRSTFDIPYMLTVPVFGSANADNIVAINGGRYYGLGGDDTLAGSDEDDLLDGGDGDDTLTDGLGGDAMAGGSGNDIFTFVAGSSTGGGDSADGGAGNDIYHVKWYSGSDRIIGLDAANSGTDRIILDGIADTMVNNYIISGNDLYVMVGNPWSGSENVLRLEGFLASGAAAHTIEFANGVILTAANFQQAAISGTQGDDVLTGGFAPDNIQGHGGNDTISGGKNGDNIAGGDGNDVIHGDEGNDSLHDGLGADVVYGDEGDDKFYVESDNSQDRFVGGGGNDHYYLRKPGTSFNAIEEDINGGIDTIYSTEYDTTLAANVENLIAEHGNARKVTYDGVVIPRMLIGNDLDNTITIAPTNGFLSHRTMVYQLDGGVGADTYIGSEADEIYVIDSLQDTIIEQDTSSYRSTDTVRASFSYSIEGRMELENIQLTVAGTTATGNAGNNKLDGSMAYGVNTLIGGDGDDTYVVDMDDLIVETAGGGRDTAVIAALSGGTFYVPSGTNVEVFRLDNALGSGSLVGNEEDNELIGNGVANSLSGGAGNDVIWGGQSTSSNVTDRLDGGEGDDQLLASNNHNSLRGGLGNDDIALSWGNDSIRYSAGDGSDNIRAHLGGFGGHDRLIFDAAINGDDAIWTRTGNDLVITFAGASGDTITIKDYWMQQQGVDVLSGVIDAFYFESEPSERPAGLTIEQLSNRPPVANVNYLDANAVNGETFSYVLDAGTFSDNDLSTLVYSASNMPSWLSFDPLTRTFSGMPNVAEGTYSSITITATDALGASASVLLSLEIMNAIDGTNGDDSLVGTSEADLIRAGAGNDTINGGEGGDRMVGGAGNDTYFVDDSNDRTIEEEDEGDDVVNSSLEEYTLSERVERLTLTGQARNGNGNDQDNILTGNSYVNFLNGEDGNDTLLGNNGNDELYGGWGDDTLDGGSGSDWMSGGGGDDIYIVTSTGDSVEEWEWEGSDTVRTSIAYTLGANVENLVLTGSSGLSGSGNELDNVLTGNGGANTLRGYDGNDRLDGGSGNDTMIGGLGNDTYVVGVSGDVVTELVNEGEDTVISAIAYTLSSNLEHLTLSGTSNINGTGNVETNILIGNAGNNALSGLAGDDDLEGMAGTDTLTGGAGNDYYIMARGYGSDTVVENDATSGITDTAYFLSTVSHDQLWFRRPSGSNNLEISIIGTTDKLIIKDWYLGDQYRVENILVEDGNMRLLKADVEALVTAMAGMTMPAQGQTTLTPSQRTALDPVFDAVWQAPTPEEEGEGMVSEIQEARSSSSTGVAVDCGLPAMHWLEQWRHGDAGDRPWMPQVQPPMRRPFPEGDQVPHLGGVADVELQRLISAMAGFGGTDTTTVFVDTSSRPSSITMAASIL